MSDAQSYFLTVDRDKPEAVSIAQGTAKKLEDKQLNFLEVVQTLGEYLTDEDVTVRAKAVGYFSAVLNALRPDYLTRQQIAVNIQFFCDRIQDASGLREATEGLAALQRCTRFSGENAVQTATALFTDAQDLQQHPQGTRFVVLTLMDALLSSQREALRAMDDDFITGITDLVSGEKDPRNLMIIFSMVKVVMVEWDISRNVEAMFDAVFCYFPITFRPPPDDPYGITAQDLKTRLRACIASTPYFAGHAFPALLDKLDSTSPNVKKDVLQTITACARSYNPATIANHSTQLWDSMKYEILTAQDDDLANEALTATNAIAGCLSTEASSTALVRLVKSITSECNEQLREPQQKQSKPAGQILESLATASPTAYALVIKAVLPPLLTLFQDAGGEISKQRALLEILIRLYDAALSVYGSWSTPGPSPDQSNPLDAFRDKLYELSSRALMATPPEEVSFRVVAVNSFLRLARLRNFLTVEEIGNIVRYLDEIILDEKSQGHDSLKDETVNALIEISRFRPDLITDVSYPAFMATLPDRHVDGDKQYRSSLEYLARLSVERAVVKLLLRRLASKFYVVVNGGGSAAYTNAILETLLYALERQDLANDPDVETYYRQFVVGLLDEAFKPRHRSSTAAVLHDDSVLDSIGRVAAVVIRALPEGTQQKIVDEEYFRPFSPSTAWEQVPLSARTTEMPFSYLIASLWPKVSLPHTTPAIRLDQLISNIHSETVPSIRLALLRQVSLIVNKLLTSPGDDALISNVAATQLSHLQSASESRPTPLEQSSLLVTIHLLKGLVLRTSPLATSLLLPPLLSLLSHPTLGGPTARSFSNLLPLDDLISRPNHAIIRLLHKQRLFSYCVPRLVSSFREAADPRSKPNYLIALSGLLANVPIEVVLPHLDELVPLLLQSLDLDSAAVKTATIETLTVTIRESPAVVEGYVSSLIARLLTCATSHSVSTPPKTRLLAVRCLASFPTHFRHELLRPHKRDVTRRLIAPLDDPKRDVRKAAVDCRRAWEGMDDAT